MAILLSFILSFIYAFMFPFAKSEGVIDSKNGGDPLIVQESGNFYYTYTTGNDIEISQIRNFDDTTVIRTEKVYSAGADDIVGDIWAPEMHKIGNRWYIISCALFDKTVVTQGTMPEADGYQDHSDYYRYGFVLESESEDIFSKYTFKGIIAPEGMNNIDGTYLRKNGKLYYVCSAYVDVAHQCIFISEMENPYTLKKDSSGNTKAVKLSAPTHYWEKIGWKVNEGPSVLYKDNETYIVYSASGFSSGFYCLGMIIFEGDDVMDAADWSKSQYRVYYDEPEKKIYNAGHCSFLYLENGDIYMVYHATSDKRFDKSPRLTHIKKVEFKDSKPCFM